MDLKVTFSDPASPSKLSKLRRLVRGANISDSADSRIRRMNKNSLFGGGGCYLKMRKCQAFAPEGVEYVCGRKQSGARVDGAINSAAEKVCESWK